MKAIVEYNNAGWDVMTDENEHVREHLARFFTSRQDAQNYADKLNSKEGLLDKILDHAKNPRRTCMCESCTSYFRD